MPQGPYAPFFSSFSLLFLAQVLLIMTCIFVSSARAYLKTAPGTISSPNYEYLYGAVVSCLVSALYSVRCSTR